MPGRIQVPRALWLSLQNLLPGKGFLQWSRWIQFLKTWYKANVQKSTMLKKKRLTCGGITAGASRKEIRVCCNWSVKSYQKITSPLNSRDYAIAKVN
jgi:hypothetical protein